MKRINILLFSIILSAITVNASGRVADLKNEFKKLDSLPNIAKLVYNGSVNPQWVNNSTFWYETREADGLNYYLVDIEKKTKTLSAKEDLPEAIARAQRPRRNSERRDTIPSPDGKLKALVKDANIWIIDQNGFESQLSYDGTENNIYTTLYWSPDSKKIVSIKRQHSPMHRIPLIESSPKSQVQPILQWRDYYKPGDMLPIYRPVLFNVEKKEMIRVENGEYDDQYYLFFGKWLDDSKGFTFEYNQRGHQLYQLLYADAGDGKTHVVAEEKFDTFVYYNRIYKHYFKDGKRLLWASERDNWMHLYIVDIQTGDIIKQLTSGQWVARDVIHIDEDNNYIIISANGKNASKGEDPYNIHYYRVDLKSGKMTDLTPEEGNHRAFYSSDYKYMVDVWSMPDTPPVSVVRNTKDGKIIMELQRADIGELFKTGFTMPEVFVSKGRDGVSDIWGTIFRPSNFDSSKSYPVVEYIYAGPHDSHVLKDFYAYLRFSKLLEMGFIVVTIDGMGTANRSKEFHDVAWRNLKDAGFPDRKIWISEAAKKYPYMDMERVGIYGYSAGGQNAMSALLFHKDLYKVGVALCGCHDNRMDKIWWNEQWMGYPIGPWYSENSNVDNAHLLEGKLLLINGELDDNVDPTSTLQVVNALVKADKDFEQLYLPGYGHSLGDDYVTRKVFEFFVNHLK